MHVRRGGKKEMNEVEAPLASLEDRLLAEYRTHVAQSGAERRVALVDSSSPAHFAIVTEQLLYLAQSRVRIFSNYLSRYSRHGHQLEHRNGERPGQPVWAARALRDAACSFLRTDRTQLDIIVRESIDFENNDPRTHPFLSAVIQDPLRKGNVTLRVARDSVNPYFDLFRHNFVVVDEVAYRHEIGDALRAVAQFGPDGKALVFVRAFTLMERDIEVEAAKNLVTSPLVASFSPNDNDLERPGHAIPDLLTIDWSRYSSHQSSRVGPKLETAY